MRAKAVAFFVACFAVAGNSLGATPTAIFSFGDSLSDAGNASIATLGAFPGANYATRTVPGVPFQVGYFTNSASTTPGSASPVGNWVDQVAAGLGIADPLPALAPAGGTNYAVGGAQTGSASAADMQNQVNLFLSQHTTGASATSLYTFWGGANDLLNGNNPVTAADNVFGQIKQVATAGGKQFLWFNLPALGSVPAGAANAAALNAATTAFNAEWTTDLNTLHSQGINVIGVDVNSLYAQLLANPAAFGFTNVTTPAQGATGADPNKYLFWDSLHPTTEGHLDIANLVLADLAVPEPSIAAFVLLGSARLLKRRR